MSTVLGGKDKYRSAGLALGIMLFFGVFLVTLLPAAQTACGLDRAHEKAVVAHVYDGDTMRLRDGRKVRLIGIDTPELGHDGEPDQPLAKAAKARLTELAKHPQAVQLRYDEQRRDSYGRMLAHVFLIDGTNVQHDMLSSGLATMIAVPPNLWQLECHMEAEAEAQTARRGVWSLPRYQPVDAKALTRDDRGFRLITGRVRRVGSSRKTVWLQLSKNVSVRVPHSHTHYFMQDSLLQLKGRQVLARGWLNPNRYGLSMTIRHPSALRVLD